MFASLMASLALARLQDAPRDFVLPVMSVEGYGKWLGGELGREVIAVPSVRDRLVFIHLKNRTYEELAGYLKEAVGVGLLDKNGVLTLTDEWKPDASQVSVEQLQAVLRKLTMPMGDRDAYEKALKEWNAIDNKPMRNGSRTMTEGESTRVSEIRRMDPLVQAGMRLMNAVGAQGLAALPLYERVVFSMNPTRLQRPWVGESGALLNDLNAAMQARNEVLPPVDVTADMRVPSGLNMASGGPGHEVRSLVAVVKRTPGSFILQVKAFGQEGETIATGQTSLFDQQADSDKRRQDRERVEKLFAAADRPAVLNEAENLEIDRLRLLGAGYAGEALTQDELKWMAGIGENEPLAGVASRLYGQALDAIGREAVAYVAPGFYFNPNKKETNLKDVGYFLLNGVQEPAVQDKGKVLIRPMTSTLLQTAIPRRAMAEVAKSILNDGSLSLGELSAATAMLGDRSQTPRFVTNAVQIADLNSGDVALETRSLPETALIAFCQLSDSQKAAILSPEGWLVRSDQLPESMRGLFEESLRSIELKGAESRRFSFDADGNRVQMLPDGWPSDVPYNGFTQEQTFFLTYSSFYPVWLRIKGSEGVGLISQQRLDGGFVLRRSMSADDVARTVAVKEAAARQGVAWPTPDMIVGQGKLTSLNVSLMYGQMVGATQLFSFLSEPIDKFGAWDELPEEAKKLVEEALAKQRKLYENAKFSNPGGQGTPPP